MKGITINLIFISVLLLLSKCKSTTASFSDKKSMVVEWNTTKYFEGPKPKLVPLKFVPNIISKKDRYEFGCTISRDGTEFYFGVDNQGKMEIHRTVFKYGKWSNQVNMFPNDTCSYNDPMFSNDDQKLYFISNRPTKRTKEKTDIDIWYIERTSNGWSSPIQLNTNINNHLDQYYTSFSNDGSIYFASKDTAENAPKYAFDIYKSKVVNGEFQQAVKLPSQINTNRYEADVFIAPDESYIIFCSIRRNGYGIGDLYISFKDNNGQWTNSINMGSVINTAKHELCPYVSPDGKYLFYTSNKDIYWVSTELIEKLKADSL